MFQLHYIFLLDTYSPSIFLFKYFINLLPNSVKMQFQKQNVQYRGKSTKSKEIYDSLRRSLHLFDCFGAWILHILGIS